MSGQFSDPFNVSQTDIPSTPGNISPDVSRNLALFGAGLSTAANARTPQGFLAYGPGFGGALGAATQQAFGQNMDIAKARAGLGLIGAQTQDVRSQAAQRNIANQLGLYNLNLTSQLYGGPQFDQQGNILAPGQQSPFALPHIGQQTQGQPASDVTVPSPDHNNPLNIRYAGQEGASNVGGFAAFPTPQAGLQATHDLMSRYGDKGINTLSGLISTWAPPSENNTRAYIDSVSKDTGIPANAPIDLHDPNVRSQIIPAMAKVEGTGRYQVANNGPPVSGPVGTVAAPMQQSQHPVGDPVALAQGILTGHIQPTAEEALAAAPLISRINPTLGAELMKYGLAGPTARETAKNQNFDLRSGGMGRTIDAQGNPVWLKNPAQMTVQLPTGQTVEGFGSPAMPGSPPGTPGQFEPMLLPGGGVAFKNVGPMQEEYYKMRGEHLGTQFKQIDDQAASAVESNYLYDNMRNDSRTWDMGKFANWEGNARAYISAMAQSLGIDAQSMNQKLADYQSFNKSAGMLLRTAVHDVSSRAAVQEYTMIGNTLPTPTTSDQAFGQIADQWQGLNDYRIAKQKFAQSFEGNPQDFNVAFNSSVSPTTFLLHRMEQTPQGQADAQAMFGRMAQTPEGRLMAKRMKQQYDYAKTHGLFDDLPPTGGAQ